MEKLETDIDNNELTNSYREALKDDNFKKLVNRLKVSEEIGKNYTSKLENTICELKNCSKCKGLMFCKNNLEGHVDYPILKNNKLVFYFTPCKYKKEFNKINKEKNTITMKDIKLDDKKRVPVIKWIKEFLDNSKNNERVKGLYLYGNFGCGKTYILSALFNELEKRRGTCEIVYFPELLRDLKSDFDNFGGKMDYLKEVDYLLIDDIGAEKVTEWGRDEILGTVLQYRMNNNKTTFFTSNLSLKDLEVHLADSKLEVNTIKARRIIERIKYLTDEMEILGENRRV